MKRLRQESEGRKLHKSPLTRVKRLFNILTEEEKKNIAEKKEDSKKDEMHGKKEVKKKSWAKKMFQRKSM